MLKRPYDLPSKLYPRKKFQLPNVMTADEIRQLLNIPSTLNQQAIIQFFYSTGVRLEECSRIKIADVDSKNMRIKVVGGKGNKDRAVPLPARPDPAARPLAPPAQPSLVVSWHCSSWRTARQRADG